MEKKRKFLLLLLAVMIVFSLQTISANGQQEGSAGGADAVASWPARDVTVYIPNPPGSPLDLSVRIMLEYLTEVTGGTFIPVNENTGVGTLALKKLSAAKPDGYTLMFTGSGSNIQYHTGQNNINPMNPDQVTIISSSAGLKVDFDSVLVTTPDHPYKTWDEFLAYVRANPGDVNYGTSTGSTVEVKARLILKQFDLEDNVKLVYSSNSEIPIGMLGGSIDAAVLSGFSAMQYLQDGSFIALMHTIDEYTGNSPLFVDLPTYTDLGCPELYSAFPMYMIGPGNMDEALVNRINSLMAGAASTDEYVERWDKMHSIYVPKSPEEIREMIMIMDKNIEQVYKN